MRFKRLLFPLVLAPLCNALAISAFSRSYMSREDSGGATSCELPLTNPDLTGIGMRISLYFQGFILALAPLFLENSRALRNIFSNTLLSSLALMAVTLVNVHTIAFIDGVAVTFLQSILLFTAFIQVEVLVALRDRTIWNMYLLAGLLRTILEVIFWGNIDAPSPLTCLNGVQQQQSTRAQEVRYVAIAFLGFALLFAVPFSILARFHGPRKSRNPWRVILVPANCIGIILQIFIIEYIIGIDDSVSGRANSWTHGQILSLLLVGSNIIDFISALRSRRRDFPLFSWRGMRLDYEICKIRCRRLLIRASKTTSHSTRPPSMMPRNALVQVLVTSEIPPPSTCLTKDRAETCRHHESQRNHITSSTYRCGPAPVYGPSRTLHEGMHRNRFERRPQLEKVSPGESVPNINLSVNNATVDVLEGDQRERPPSRPRRWSF